MSLFIDESSASSSRPTSGTYLTIEVSPGELIDRATIVELKARRVADPMKRQVAASELARLSLLIRQVQDGFGSMVDLWMVELRDINSRLWDLESDLRAQMAAFADSEQLSRRSREIVRLNDLRATTKSRINAVVGIDGEVKVYSAQIGAVGRGARQPYFIVTDFLSPDEKEELLESIILRKSEFGASAVSSKAANYRASLVAAADVGTSALFSRRIAEHLPLLASIADDGVRLAPEELECQITAHTDLCYFHVHSDNGSDATRHRALTFVYYLRLRPNSFFGGELKLYPDRKRLDEVVLIPPTDNSAVFFRSELLHEVILTYVPSGAFEDSRFTVNGWIANSTM